VLLLLLLEAEAPLIVDQPEDDLDNRFITDGIVPTMKYEKKKRQFVFSTHNANIPVLGDAELIIGLTPGSMSDDRQSRIERKHMGSIDSRPVREMVEEILEGGKAAFEMRLLRLGMITRVELLELLRNNENSEVEFKRDDIENHELAEELVAFSNLEGGTVSGIMRDNLEEWVMNACRDKIGPAIIPSYTIIQDVEPGKDVAIISVPRGSNVHSKWHNNRHRYFIRIGITNREPTPEELSRLFQKRGMFRAELMPVPRSCIVDLDRHRLRNYFVNIRQQEVPADSEEVDWQILLSNTEIMEEDGVTIAGLLLIQLRGPMTPLLNEQNEVIEAGLVEQTVDFVNRNTGVTAILKDGVRRVEIPEYPTEVIRETVVNALVHRDYLLANTDIELCVYSDRLEVVSPGQLPNGITTVRMRTGCRSARNQLVRDVMRDYGFMEHMGMGVPRKIIRGMKEHNGTDPELLEEDERFIVRLDRG